MTDELLLRRWTDAHGEFTGDFDRGVLRLGRFLKARFDKRRAANEAYASQSSESDEGSKTARAALAGVLACLATSVLLVTMATLAVAGTPAATGLAVVPHVIVA